MLMSQGPRVSDGDSTRTPELGVSSQILCPNLKETHAATWLTGLVGSPEDAGALVLSMPGTATAAS